MRRKYAELRNSVQQSLAKRPMTIHELCVDTGASRSAIKKQIEWLAQLGIVKRYNITFRDPEKMLWELTKE